MLKIIFFILLLFYCFKKKTFGLNIEINPRVIISFNNEWQFQRTSSENINYIPIDNKWRNINLPHDWGIEGFLEEEITTDYKKNGDFSFVKGEWKFNKGDSLVWKEINFNDENWQRVFLPASWEEHSSYKDDYVYGWYRKEVIIPNEYKDKDILINLGFIADVDETYFNGYFIGGTGRFPPNFVTAWNKQRIYKVKKEIIKYGEKNIIAIRVFNATGPGGIWAEDSTNFIDGPFNNGADGREANGFLPGGIGWYKKEFVLKEDWKDKNIFIEFDGIYMNSDVWINDNYLGNHPYGYTSFSYNLTPYLKFGNEKNIILVRVNVKQQCTRWYSGAGIYRNVRLVITDKIYIPQWGVYVFTKEVKEDYAILVIRTKIKNNYINEVNISLKTSIKYSDIELSNISTSDIIDSNSCKEIIQEVIIKNPKLWSIEQPYLYFVESKIFLKNELKDIYTTRFGIRKLNLEKMVFI